MVEFSNVDRNIADDYDGAWDANSVSFAEKEGRSQRRIPEGLDLKNARLCQADAVDVDRPGTKLSQGRRVVRIVRRGKRAQETSGY